jgi:hypothetical protein
MASAPDLIDLTMDSDEDGEGDGAPPPSGGGEHTAPPAAAEGDAVVVISDSDSGSESEGGSEGSRDRDPEAPPLQSLKPARHAAAGTCPGAAAPSAAALPGPSDSLKRGTAALTHVSDSLARGTAALTHVSDSLAGGVGAGGGGGPPADGATSELELSEEQVRGAACEHTSTGPIQTTKISPSTELRRIGQPKRAPQSFALRAAPRPALLPCRRLHTLGRRLPYRRPSRAPCCRTGRTCSSPVVPARVRSSGREGLGAAPEPRLPPPPLPKLAPGARPRPIAALAARRGAHHLTAAVLSLLVCAGKSFLMSHIIKGLRREFGGFFPLRVAVTASTGIAATHIGGARALRGAGGGGSQNVQVQRGREGCIWHGRRQRAPLL